MIIVTAKKIGTVDAISMFNLIIEVMQKHYNQILEAGNYNDQITSIKELVEAALKAKYGFTPAELTVIAGLKWEHCVSPMWDTLLMSKDNENTEIEV